MWRDAVSNLNAPTDHFFGPKLAQSSRSDDQLAWGLMKGVTVYTREPEGNGMWGTQAQTELFDMIIAVSGMVLSEADNKLSRMDTQEPEIMCVRRALRMEERELLSNCKWCNLTIFSKSGLSGVKNVGGRIRRTQKIDEQALGAGVICIGLGGIEFGTEETSRCRGIKDVAEALEAEEKSTAEKSEPDRTVVGQGKIFVRGLSVDKTLDKIEPSAVPSCMSSSGKWGVPRDRQGDQSRDDGDVPSFGANYQV
ncbi:hypothetical protein B0H11DRAFT_1906483 [Mycena galericulata]|nr:hypothetical protein B0H11DRAFT_1906483 [Mycena galericulata]